ncbi:MAG: Rha family transcriptional regulator [Lachnospiraceae bacterium]|nr:Rha family transcriptional regulator [Lachnospiraceae bacterium]
MKNNKAVCTSLQVAEKFEKRHDNVMRDIRGLLKNEETQQMFKLSSYIEKQNGQKYPMCYMNRDGFSLLAMGFTGKKALNWKIQYIKAFNTMEEILKEHNTQLWINTRQTNKENRLKETDTIKLLQDYAKGQGSTHSDKLYVVYTNLAKRFIGGKRDNVGVSELNTLTLIEGIILQTIQAGMSRQMYYKEIYKDCKNRIEQFATIAYLTGNQGRG